MKTNKHLKMGVELASEMSYDLHFLKTVGQRFPKFIHYANYLSQAECLSKYIFYLVPVFHPR
jgi:hypothetical protein